MKLLKNILCLTALCAISSVSARPRGDVAQRPSNQPAPQGPNLPQPGSNQPAPQQQKLTFKQALEQVKKMTTDEVIGSNGVFTQNFTQFIKSSGLDPELIEALLQAGKNLHLPLSGNTRPDLDLVDYAQDQINNLVAQLKIENTPVPVLPAFYNKKTALFDVNFLNKRVAVLDQNMDRKVAEKTLLQELMPRIAEIWKKTGVTISMAQTEAAQQQIITAINNRKKPTQKEEETAGNQPAPVPQPITFNSLKKNNQEAAIEFVERLLKSNKAGAASIVKKNDDGTVTFLKNESSQKFITNLVQNINQEYSNLTNNELQQFLLLGIQSESFIGNVQNLDEVEKYLDDLLPAQPQPLASVKIVNISKEDHQETMDAFVKRLISRNQYTITDYLFAESTKPGYYEYSIQKHGTNPASNLLALLAQNIKREYPAETKENIATSLAKGIWYNIPQTDNMNKRETLKEFIQQEVKKAGI